MFMRFPHYGAVSDDSKDEDQTLVEDLEVIKEELADMPEVAVSGAAGTMRQLGSLLVPKQKVKIISKYPELGKAYTPRLTMAIAVATLGNLNIGFSLGVLNVPEMAIRSSLTPVDMGKFMWSVIVACFAVGAIAGAYLSSWAADRWGRRPVILWTNAGVLLGTLLQSTALAVWMMVLGRLLVGLACGTLTVVTPLYLGEVSPAHLRGTVGAASQLAVVMGLLLSGLFAKPLENNWRWLLGLPVIPCLLQLCLCNGLPESPRWLVAMCRHDDALEIICKLRGIDNLEFHPEVIRSCAPLRVKPRGVYRRLFDIVGERGCSLSIIIVLVLHVGQQFTGINAVFYYSAAYFDTVNIDPWVGSMAALAANVLSVLVALPLIDLLGRRLLLSISLLGMAACCATLVISQLELKPGEQCNSCVGGVIAFVCFFELGMGPIPWLMTVELFPSELSSWAVGFASVINWTANFVVGLAFPKLASLCSTFVFLPFGIVCLFCLAFVLAFVPETKMKTLREIQHMMEVQR